MNDQSIKKKVQVVVIAENAVLLLEFNNTRGNNYVGFQNITGEVEGIETFEAAALREVHEEIGVNAPGVIDLDVEYKFLDRWKRNCFEKVYLCFLSKKPEIVLSQEHLNFKWIAFSEVQKTDYTFPSNHEAFLFAKKYLESKK